MQMHCYNIKVYESDYSKTPFILYAVQEPVQIFYFSSTGDIIPIPEINQVTGITLKLY